MGVDSGGAHAVAHYQCMDFAQLAAMEPQRLAAKDCVLLLWVVHNEGAC